MSSSEELAKAAGKIVQLQNVLIQLIGLTEWDKESSIESLIYYAGKTNYLAHSTVSDLILWQRENPWFQDAKEQFLKLKQVNLDKC